MEISTLRTGDIIINNFTPAEDAILLQTKNFDLDRIGSKLTFENRGGTLYAMKNVSADSDISSNSLLTIDDMLTILSFIKKNKKLDAVKYIKDITNVGLKESKEILDDICMLVK